METCTSQQKITLAFINDKSPILDLICNDLIASGLEVLSRFESIDDGLRKLFPLNELPEACIIDLDFYDNHILKQLQKLKRKYPTIKLIAHSDIDTEKAVKPLLEIGFDSYLLIGSDADNFKEAINIVANGGRYFSVGVAEIAQEYFTNN